MNIGFIGCGNMATAIIKGITENKVVKASDIYAFDTYETGLDNVCGKYQINKLKSASEVVKTADIVVLAVKPNVLENVLNGINESLKTENVLIISIAAGKTISYIRGCISQNNKIVRVMPNINAKVKEAMSAYCFNDAVCEEDKINVEKIFGGVGKVMCLEESFFPLFGVLGGCTPAFAYMFIDELARVGVENGMKKSVALEVAAQAVYGSAKMILESSEHPYELIDQVCSPGGTTIEGVLSLQADGFESAVHNAVQKAVDKDKKI